MNQYPTKEEFAAHLNTVFHSQAEGGPAFDLILIKVEGKVSNEEQESFSLLFRSPLDVPPAQGMYATRHDALGEHSIFMTPIRQAEDGFVYEAVFNWLL
jgi:hypothetical protein